MFAEPRDLERKIADLENTKGRLNKYAFLINNTIGNNLGFTIHQVLWSSEHYREEVIEKVAFLAPIELPFAAKTRPAELAELEETIDQLRRHLLAIGGYGSSSPWWGYFPERLMFGEDEVVGQILRQLSDAAWSLHSLIIASERELSVWLPKKEDESRELCTILERLPALSGEEAFDLLPAILTDDFPEVIRQFEKTVQFIKDKQQRIKECLHNPDEIDHVVVEKAHSFLNQAFRLNQARTPGSMISERAAAAQQIIDDTKTALELLLNVGEVCGITTEPTLRAFEFINAIIRVAETALVDLLHLRSPHLSEQGVLEFVCDARDQSEILRTKKSELQRLFALNLVRRKEEVVFAISAFMAHDGIARFISRDWWRARRIYRSIRFTEKRSTKLQQCARELGELLDFIESCERFEADTNIKRVAGSLFSGIDTDFSKLERICRWYRSSQNETLRNYLGRRYKGFATDLAPVLSAFKWASAVRDLHLPPEIEKWLLTSEAHKRASLLVTFLHDSDAKWQELGKLRSELERFGPLDWNKWHQDQVITPDVVRNRADEALQALDSLVVWADLSRAIQNTTPLAKALLGAAVGDEVEMNVPGRAPRMLKVLSIER